MAYFVPSSTGISIVSSENSLEEKKYAPVYSEKMSMEFIWDSLPDFYRNFLSGSEYLSSAWSGASQVIASDLLNLFQTDYAKSLRDIPTFSQRKWTKFEIENEVDFFSDPKFSTSGISNKFSYSSANQNLGVTFTQRSGGADKYQVDLNGTVNQESSLVWSFDVNVSSADSISSALLGYIDKTSTGMSKSLLLGLINVDSSIRICLIHTPTEGVASVTKLGSGTLSLAKDYTIEAEYSSSESTVRASAVEKKFQRVSSSTGTTSANPDGTITVKLLTDSSATFLTSGVIPGDFVVFDGFEHEIVEASQTSLVVKHNTLPASASAMSYAVVGKEEVDSISLNLLNESSKAFSCDSFGLMPGVPFPLRTLFTALKPSSVYSVHAGNSLACSVDNLKYSDPTFSEVPVRLPKLQNSPLGPTSIKRQNVDYVVQSSQISFSLPTRGSWYSEFGLFDESVIYDNFGQNAGIAKEAASDEYLNRVRGLYYSLLKGPTASSIKTGVSASVGLPLAIESGLVTAINPAYSGKKGQITIGNSRTYLYPLAVGTDLSVGDSVQQFTPLSKGVEVFDYISRPTWFSEFPVIKEVQKYHTFLVKIDLDALDDSVSNSSAAFQGAAKHLAVIKPTYKDFVFVGSRSVSDVTAIDDVILLAPTLHVEDAISEPYPAYDDTRFYSDDYDWAYDQGQTEWDNIPGSVAFFAYSNTEAKAWNGASAQKQFLVEENARLTEGSETFTDASYSFIGTIGQLVSDVGSGGSTDSSSSMIFTGAPTERFLTSIPNTGGTPSRTTSIAIRAGSAYGVVTVTSILSNTQLQTSYTSSTLKSKSSIVYEVRTLGPVGTMLVDKATGGTIGGGTLGKFSDSGAAFNTSVPNTTGVPNSPTYVAINASSATPTIRKVIAVDSATVLSVSPDWAGAATNEDYAVWVPTTALTASEGDVLASVAASGSTATASHTSVVTSTSGVTASVATGVFGLKDASNDPMGLNIDEDHALIITAPSAIAGSYRVTGLFAAGGSNHIITAPPIASAQTSVNYEVRRGNFHTAVTGNVIPFTGRSLLRIDSGANAGTYTITQTNYVTDSGLSSCTISGSFAGSASAAGLWYTRADVWARVSYVASDTKIHFTASWPGASKTSASDAGGGTSGALVTYTAEDRPIFFSEVDLRALEARYDQSDEYSPDEDVQLQWKPAVGYGGELLHDASSHLIFTTDGSNTDEIDHTNALTSTAPSANDVIVLPNGRAREVSSYAAGLPGTITLVGTNSAQNDGGSAFTSAALYLIPAASVATAGTSFTFSNGSANVVVAGSLSGAALSAGVLIQPLLPSGSGDNTTDLPVVEIATVPSSYPGTITLTSNYTGGSIVTTKSVVRSTSSMATALGSYFTLTNADFHNVEVPGAAQTMLYTIPENVF